MMIWDFWQTLGYGFVIGFVAFPVLVFGLMAVDSKLRGDK